MSESDAKYLGNYLTDQLYTIPAGDKLAYASIVTEVDDQIEFSENDTVWDLGSFNVSPQIRLAVKAFYVGQKEDWKRLSIIKLRLRKGEWVKEQEIALSKFDGEKLNQFLTLLASLDMNTFQTSEKFRMNLGAVNVESLGALLSSDKSDVLLDKLAHSPNLQRDVFAVEVKRAALNRFREMLSEDHSEEEWQNFFENNVWIFGYGLGYIFLEKSQEKLEVVTTGATYNAAGKRVDALMQTASDVSQYVLVEIKKPSTKLLKLQEYRSGCWQMSNELSGAVSQIQKTTFDFVDSHKPDESVDEKGNRLGQMLYKVMPRAFLVIGQSSELNGNDNKITSFELYRRNTQSPEIITFDELLKRAEHIVEHLEDVSGVD